jgi:hypothetical protein
MNRVLMKRCYIMRLGAHDYLAKDSSISDPA